jgi:hypothetical protein
MPTRRRHLLLAVVLAAGVLATFLALRGHETPKRPPAAEPTSCVPWRPAPRLALPAPAVSGPAEDTPRSAGGEPPLPSLPPAAPPAATGPASEQGHGAVAAPARPRFLDVSDGALGELARSTDSPMTRAELLLELGRRRTGLLTLLAFLDDASPPVRAAAARGLELLADPRALGRLRDAAARERDPVVASEMARARDVVGRVAMSPH